MEKNQLLKMLKQTLSDYRLSRGEKKTVKEFVEHYFRDNHSLAMLRSEVFELAKSELISPDDSAVMDWLEEVVKLLLPRSENQTKPIRSDAVFSTQEDCVGRLQRLISATHRSLDICVFTITDDRITREIMDAFERNVSVRILTDDDKANDRGSDVYQLRRAGVPTRTDRNPNHMHHKFALFDNKQLLNGSYNWTRSASLNNEENFVITDDPKLVDQFQKHFERLWVEFE